MKIKIKSLEFITKLEHVRRRENGFRLIDMREQNDEVIIVSYEEETSTGLVATGERVIESPKGISDVEDIADKLKRVILNEIEFNQRGEM